MQILPCFIFLVLFSKRKYGFIEKSSPSEKKIILKEELDCIDIDGIGNFEDSPRLVFIDGKRENLIVVRRTYWKYSPKEEVRHFIRAYRCPLSDKRCRREYFFNNHVEYLL